MGVAMNYTEQEAIAHNFKVLAGLRDLFQLLSEHGAVIGRDSARVVVDLNKAPSIMLDEIGEIFRTSTLVAPNGTMRIFGDFQTDDETDVLLLNIGSTLKGNDTVFAKFPAFNETKEWLEGIQAMSEEQSQAYEALHESLEANFMGLLVKHREALFEGLFGGGDSPNWTYHDPEDRKLN